MHVALSLPPGRKDRIWYRKGACNASPLGQCWKTVSGSLRSISIGNCGVWGINADQVVYYRLNTFGDPDDEGTGWIRVEGRFQTIYSGPKAVLALAGNRDIYYRANLGRTRPGDNNFPNFSRNILQAYQIIMSQ